MDGNQWELPIFLYFVWNHSWMNGSVHFKNERLLWHFHQNSHANAWWKVQLKMYRILGSLEIIRNSIKKSLTLFANSIDSNGAIFFSILLIWKPNLSIYKTEWLKIWHKRQNIWQLFVTNRINKNTELISTNYKVHQS